MATRVITFDNFRGGELGQLSPSTAPRDMFVGSNVMVYRDGLIGPRPGLKNVTPGSGLSNGAVGAMGVTRGADSGGIPTAALVYTQGTNVRVFTLNGSVANAGTVGNSTTPGAGQMVQAGRDVYAILGFGSVYRIEVGSLTTTALSGAPSSPGTIAQYGERIILSGFASGRRISYSAKADPTSWPAANFIDIPGPRAGAVYPTNLYVTDIRQRLAIANDVDEWWALSGVPGVNDVLRRQQRADRVPATKHAVARVGEALYFICSDGSPAIFSGTTTEKTALEHLKRWTQGDRVFGAATLQHEDCFIGFSESEQAILFANDAWTFHGFNISTAYPFIVGTGEVAATAVGTSRVYIICDGGSGGTTPKFYAFDPLLNRPGKTGDTYANAGDDNNTPPTAGFDTAVTWGKDGEELRPRFVTVNFHKWNTGSATANGFEMRVIAYHRRDKAGSLVGDAHTFSEAASATTSDRMPHSITFQAGGVGFARGFQIQFANLRGCAIHSISVECETR